MLEKVLDIKIGKAETTSNWLQRPLTKKQEMYAALDVAYLAEVCLQQVELMQSRDCYAWFLEDSVKGLEKIANVDNNRECDDYYLRFSQMWNIADYKLVALKEISRWREVESRRKNKPRNWVLKNQSIISIINQWPTNRDQLSRVDDIKADNLREDAQPILDILSSAKQLLLKEGVVEKINKPLDPLWNKRLRTIKQIGLLAVQSQGVAPELVLRKKDLEALVRSKEQWGEYRIPEGITGWREKLFGDELLAQLNQYELS